MFVKNAPHFQDSLAGKTVLITGAGGGIGYEAARALVWMGANVVIAEIDTKKGQFAANQINEEQGTDRACFYPIDITSEDEIEKLHADTIARYGFVDVIFNNATVALLGAVDEVSIDDWDKSYAVNLRGPVMLAQKFLPDMKKRNAGTIIFVPSSGAAPFMGAYETFKTAQVEVCNTLAAELEGTDICVFSIGPGLVKTQTAHKSIEKVAAQMNISIDAFYEMNAKHILDVEHAGAGFAIAVVHSKAYHGQEVSSIQALMDAGLYKKDEEPATEKALDADGIEPHILHIIEVFDEQYEGWQKRNVFERQWVLRDFKKEVKLSAEQFKFEIDSLASLLTQRDFKTLRSKADLLMRLKGYYEHQLKLLQGYERDPKKLEENSLIMCGWIEELELTIAKL